MFKRLENNCDLYNSLLICHNGGNCELNSNSVARCM